MNFLLKFPTFFILILLSTFVVSCNHRPIDPGDVTLNSKQVRMLATIILTKTPEHIHMPESSNFTWIWLDLKSKNNPPELEEEVIRQLREKYTVYLQESEIPKDKVHTNEQGERIGFSNGFRFSFETEIERSDVVKINFSDWVGNLGASWHWAKYKWDGIRWKVIEKPSTFSIS